MLDTKPRRAPRAKGRASFWIARCVGICVAILAPVFAGPAWAQSKVSKEIALSDWGLTHPSQIGFMSLGILKTKKGAEIIVYDIRDSKPRFSGTGDSKGRAPAFSGDVFLIGHFHEGNVNRLGGYFNGFKRAPSTASLAIDPAPDGTPALTFGYRNRPPGFSGFWVHLFDFKRPPAERVFLDATPFEYLTFAIRGHTGSERLDLRMADRTWEMREDSVRIGSIASFFARETLGQDWQRVWVPLEKLPASLNRRELASLVFQVPGKGEGRVYVKDVALTRKRGVPIPQAKATNVPRRLLAKAMWLWETNKVVQSEAELTALIDFCKRHAINELFVQIPYEAELENGAWVIEWDATPMRPFLARLHRSGIRVHALDGDRRYALRKWHGRVLGLIDRVVQYNKSVIPEARFAGIRYDNEPYLLPSFSGVQKESILGQYLELLENSQNRARQGGLVFGVDIPFWFDDVNEFFEPTAMVRGRPVSEAILDIVDNVGIMDYRTTAYGADGVIAHGMNELRYAEKAGKKVYIGLETVWLPDETIYEFGSKGRGSKVRIEPLDADRMRLDWIPAGVPVAAGGGRVLHQKRAVNVPSSKITFDRKTPEDLETVLRQSERELRRFSSFHGFVIHSYESYRSWLERERR